MRSKAVCPVPAVMLWPWLGWLRQAPLTEVTSTVYVFPQVTFLMEHAAFVVLHDPLLPPLSATADTVKLSPPSTASQETVMLFDKQLTSALTF